MHSFQRIIIEVSERTSWDLAVGIAVPSAYLSILTDLFLAVDLCFLSLLCVCVDVSICESIVALTICYAICCCRYCLVVSVICFVYVYVDFIL